MSSALPDDVRRLVAERAGYRCEYCLISEAAGFSLHQIDHIIARKHGGRSTLDNLAFSCAPCNKRKGSDVASYDEATDQVVASFHPRRDVWARHFRLEGVIIAPLSAVGRVTVSLLQLNRSDLLIERELLLEVGQLHPPG